MFQSVQQKSMHITYFFAHCALGNLKVCIFADNYGKNSQWAKNKINMHYVSVCIANNHAHYLFVLHNVHRET